MLEDYHGGGPCTMDSFSGDLIGSGGQLEFLQKIFSSEDFFGSPAGKFPNRRSSKGVSNESSLIELQNDEKVCPYIIGH